MKRKKVTHPFRFILLLGLLFLGWRYYDKGTLIDESDLSGKFELAVNKILFQHGVGDSTISKVHRTERKKSFPLPTSWIETEREVSLPSHISLSPIIEEIKQISSTFKIATFLNKTRATVHSNSPAQGEKIIIECSRRGQIFQRLIFLKDPSTGRAGHKDKRFT